MATNGHVTATTVPCKLQQWDRYRVPQNVFLYNYKSSFSMQRTRSGNAVVKYLVNIGM